MSIDRCDGGTARWLAPEIASHRPPLAGLPYSTGMAVSSIIYLMRLKDARSREQFRAGSCSSLSDGRVDDRREQGGRFPFPISPMRGLPSEPTGDEPPMERRSRWRPRLCPIRIIGRSIATCVTAVVATTSTAKRGSRIGSADAGMAATNAWWPVRQSPTLRYSPVNCRCSGRRRRWSCGGRR